MVLEICGDTMVHLESTLLNNMVPRRACLIVQLATTKIVADCTLTQRVYIPLPVFVGLCVSLLLLDGVFCVKLMHVYACASVCICLSIHALSGLCVCVLSNEGAFMIYLCNVYVRMFA